MSKKKKKTIARKRARKTKLRLPPPRLRTRADVEKELVETNRAFLRGQDDLREKKKESDNRLNRIEKLVDEVGRLHEEREMMLRDYYELGRCLTTTREMWVEAEARLKEGGQTRTFRIETRVADGVGDSDGSPKDGKPGEWVKEEFGL